MKTHVWAMMALIIIGIYVLPNVTARFAGSHTMEYNETGNIYAIACTKCHSYIVDELGATDLSTDVANAHRAAAENSLYIGIDGEINITRDELPLFGEAMVNVCLLCHLVEQDSISINQTHTMLTIRVCTDPDCHGNSTTRGSDYYNTAGGVGPNLSSSSDSHSGFFKGLESQTSGYVNEDGGNYSAGFFACMGCHTHVGITFNLDRPNMLSFNLSKNVVGGVMQGFTLENIWIGESSNITTGQKYPGGVWS